MKVIGIFANLVGIVLVAYLVVKGIPELISAKDDVEVAVGVGLILLAVAFIIARFKEIYNSVNEEIK